MTYRFGDMARCFAGVLLLSVVTAAAPIANCNASLTVCAIPENVLLQLPFEAFAGDVVLTEPNGTASDVFRIFNNVINTGAGTGLGDMAFLYSSDDATLPATSTYSANVVFLAENPSGVTSFVGNGTDYLLGAPEPKTFGLLSSAIALLVVLARRRCSRIQGDI